MRKGFFVMSEVKIGFQVGNKQIVLRSRPLK